MGHPGPVLELSPSSIPDSSFLLVSALELSKWAAPELRSPATRWEVRFAFQAAGFCLAQPWLLRALGE